MSSATSKAVQSPLLSWAIHDYIQFGEAKGLAPTWQATTRHLLRLLLLGCTDIPVDTIGRQQIDMFWHAFRYWPAGAARRRDLVGCTDTQILTVGFIEAKPPPAAASYGMAYKTIRHFFAWLQGQGLIAQTPVELNAVIKHKPATVPFCPSSQVQALVYGARRAHRLPAVSQVVLAAWKRPDPSPLIDAMLGISIERFVRAQRVDRTGLANLRNCAGTLRILFAALDDMPLAAISEVHVERFWQLHHWWPQNRPPQWIDLEALTDSQVLEIGSQERAKPSRPSAVAHARAAIAEFFDWVYREGATVSASGIDRLSCGPAAA